MNSERIYPVPIKPPSGITNWGQWPTDVEPTLLLWNRQGKLSFGSHEGHGPRVFKCPDCGEFCEHRMTPFVRTNREKKRGWGFGTHICDECLILRAREKP